ncbi:MAG: alpha/beta fold hydrolase [Clostridia bacterium]|nr:alpha/beta fold hydrolase [Clostridia bacterium]
MLFEKQILGVYRRILYSRCDDTGTAYYFTTEDFPGLSRVPYRFASSLGHTLQGCFYSYENEKYPDRLVVFEHGFGGGHSAYMREIELLCRHGFTVFAYDHTGCMESGGAGTNGLSQSLHDLDDCLRALKANEKYKNKRFSIMGHSWGGFSTMNICALHPEVTHIVAMAGFPSVEALFRSAAKGMLAPLRHVFLKEEAKSNPAYCNHSAFDALQNCRVPCLLIYGEKDMLCTKKGFYDPLCKTLADNKNISLMLCNGKGHNPNYTQSAEKYLAQYGKERKKFAKTKPSADQKQAFVASYDWRAMTDQDEAVWEKIFEVLDRE